MARDLLLVKKSELYFMLSHRSKQKQHRRGFTLGEVLISFLIFSLTIAGLLFGYSEVNRMCEFSSESLAAQSAANEGLEQMRSAQWDYVRWPNTNFGLSTGDDLGFTNGGSFTTNIVDYLDVPSTGTPLPITNFITVTYVLTNYNPSLPPMRQIRSDVVWTYPYSGQICTNTAISLRAPDQ